MHFLLALIALLPGTLVAAEIVATAEGTIAGVEKDHFVVYEGVPFAQPPVGEGRWRAPAAVKPWRGTLQATAFKPMCMTSIPAIPGGEMGPMSEDCLYLNLWRPKTLGKGQKLPVMVFMYGGGFRGGSGSFPLYWGEQLAQKGVITVNLSYRVGTFGFLSHPELSRESGTGTSGNYAILDLIAGLQWVQRNIAAFGGDPERVTIWGHSAGSLGVGYLMVSPLARGLFAGAIAQSGADLNAPESPLEAEAAGRRWMQRLGVRSLDEMRKMPAEKLEALDGKWPEDEQGALKVGSFIVRDGHVFTASMGDVLAAGEQAKVPLLLGSNRDEADWYHWSMWTWARLQSASSSRPVFLYQFAFPPNAHLAGKEPVPAEHGYELGYVFHHPDWLSADTIRSGLEEMELMSSFWVQFAKTGDPNAPGRTTWQAYTVGNPVRMVFDARNRAERMTPQEESGLQALESKFSAH